MNRVDSIEGVPHFGRDTSGKGSGIMKCQQRL